MTHPEQPGNWSDPSWSPTSGAAADPTAPTVPVSGQGYAQPVPAYEPSSPGYGTPGYGAPVSGTPGYGAPGYGAPGYDTPGYGTRGYGTPEYGTPGYGTAGYATPGYGGPEYPTTPDQGYAVPMYPVGGPPPAAATNGLAIASLVCALAGLLTCGVTSFIGAILGHVAKRQIRERREGGEGLATAGIITGWIIFTLFVLVAIAYAILFVAIFRNTPGLLDPTPTAS
jgi:hypothetical protein